MFPAVWKWIRSPKNLAVLVAVGGAVGFLVNFVFMHGQRQPSFVSQQPVVVSPQINIQNNPANVINILPQYQTVKPQSSSSSATETPRSQSPTASASAIVHVPVRRNVGLGVPVDIIPGFSVTVDSIIGFAGRFDVELKSEIWGGEKRSFTVGAPPIDVTVKGRTYQLSVEDTDSHSALVVLGQTKS